MISAGGTLCILLALGLAILVSSENAPQTKRLRRKFSPRLPSSRFGSSIKTREISLAQPYFPAEVEIKPRNKFHYPPTDTPTTLTPTSTIYEDVTTIAPTLSPSTTQSTPEIEARFYNTNPTVQSLPFSRPSLIFKPLIAAPATSPNLPPTVSSILTSTLAPTIDSTFAHSLPPTNPPNFATSLAPINNNFEYTFPHRFAPTGAPSLLSSLAPTTFAPSLPPTISPTFASNLIPINNRNFEYTLPHRFASTVAPSLASRLAPTTFAPHFPRNFEYTFPRRFSPTVAPSLPPSVTPTTFAPSLPTSIPPDFISTLANVNDRAFNYFPPTVAQNFISRIASTPAPSISLPALSSMSYIHNQLSTPNPSSFAQPIAVYDYSEEPSNVPLHTFSTAAPVPISTPRYSGVYIPKPRRPAFLNHSPIIPTTTNPPLSRLSILSRTVPAPTAVPVPVDPELFQPRRPKLKFRRPIERIHNNEEEGPAFYSFRYNVNAPETGDIKEHEETRRDDVVKGFYSLIQPDGRRRIVEYTADDVNGFNALVRYEDTEFVKLATAHPPPYRV